uniref:Uncharacterized protein n=1 Tax=Oryza brachyantha TaxID=4533 RepID=J3MXN9_ORYBR
MSDGQSRRSGASSTRRQQDAELAAAQERRRAAAQTAAAAARAARLAAAELAAIRAEAEAEEAEDAARAAEAEVETLRSSINGSIVGDITADRDLEELARGRVRERTIRWAAAHPHGGGGPGEHASADGAPSEARAATAFPKGSPLLGDISKAILNITEGDSIMQLQKKWVGYQNDCKSVDSALGSVSDPDKLSVDSFKGLLILTGVASTSSLIIAVMIYLYEKHKTMIRMQPDQNGEDLEENDKPQEVNGGGRTEENNHPGEVGHGKGKYLEAGDKYPLS